MQLLAPAQCKGSRAMNAATNILPAAHVAPWCSCPTGVDQRIVFIILSRHHIVAARQCVFM
jgi:hypothetical protein